MKWAGSYSQWHKPLLTNWSSQCKVRVPRYLDTANQCVHHFVKLTVASWSYEGLQYFYKVHTSQVDKQTSQKHPTIRPAKKFWNSTSPAVPVIWAPIRFRFCTSSYRIVATWSRPNRPTLIRRWYVPGCENLSWLVILLGCLRHWWASEKSGKGSDMVMAEIFSRRLIGTIFVVCCRHVEHRYFGWWINCRVAYLPWSVKYGAFSFFSSGEHGLEGIVRRFKAWIVVPFL